MENNWWKNNYIDRRVYLLENFKNYSFTSAEFLLIMEIDLLNSTNALITIPKLAEILRTSTVEIDKMLGKLTKEGWVMIELTAKRMIIKLDPIFENKQVTIMNQTLFDLFETQFKRPLNSKEMDQLAKWMQAYTEDEIRSALREALVYQKVSFSYVNSILTNMKAREGMNEQNA